MKISYLIMKDLFDESRLFRYLLIWHGFSIALALLIYFVDGGTLFLSLFLWTSIVLLAYHIKPSYFILSAFVLSIIEETLIYYMGGGMHGKATSLLDLYANALPVFAAIILGWYYCCTRYDIKPVQLYLFSGLHGVFLELVLSGLIFVPLYVILFGGPVIFIYGSILISPEQPVGELEFNKTAQFKSWVFVLFLMVLSGFVGSYFDARVG